MIRVARAAEYGMVRWALGQALATAGDIEDVGEAATVEETRTLIARVKPDLLVLDTTILDQAGFDLLAELRHLEAGPLVVVLGPRPEEGYGARVMMAGAHGYLDTSAGPKDLTDAIHTVQRGETVMPPEVARHVAEGQGHPASALTAREQQVMELLARGLTNREIALDLGISIRTVDTHRGHLLKKLGLRNNAELTRFAVRHHYVAL